MFLHLAEKPLFGHPTPVISTLLASRGKPIIAHEPIWTLMHRPATRPQLS
jgi:hypothetical protein